MRIDSEEVRRIAQLARLALDDDTVERFRGQLQSILDHVAMLDTLGVEGVAPTAHPLDARQPLRADSVAPSLPVEEALRGAPEALAGLFRVPKVLGE
jgi:aspartyl-tRNA(Asn)/glutamyl-tRNA(Gln) amidotransferase subunit C